MILCEYTPSGGSLVRMALVDTPLTYQWYGYLQSVSSVKLQLGNQWGGYAQPTFSTIEMTPEPFESGDWPPAKSASFKLMWTESDEDAAVTIFDGTALLSTYDREAVVYNLSSPEFDATVSDGTVFSGTLNSVMATLCGSSYLNLTLDTTNARSTSPSVSFTLSGDTQAIDLADDLCQFFCHAFYISNSTLYLIDMLSSDTATELTEFDVQPCSYSVGELLSLVSSDNGSVSGSYSNGGTLEIATEYCSTTNLTTNLTNIKTMAEKDVAEINMMMSDSTPQILDVITLFDESTPQDTTATGRVTSIIYNFDDETVQLEAVGTVE